MANTSGIYSIVITGKWAPDGFVECDAKGAERAAEKCVAALKELGYSISTAEFVARKCRDFCVG